MRILPALGAVLLLVHVAACKDTLPPAPGMDLTVTPMDGPDLRDSVITITGSALTPLIDVDFGNINSSVVDSRFTATLGNKDLAGVHLISKNQITAIVPAGIRDGLYPISVSDGFGHTITKQSAYRVRVSDCKDFNDPSAIDCNGCMLVPGCHCLNATTCGVMCGDGVVRAPKQCDDGNTMDGDGCSHDCKMEPGFMCPRTGGPCVHINTCGDGVVDQGYEGCDDGNTSPGDGCDGMCSVEKGWTCTTTTSPSQCRPICGDGITIRGFEECDDGNTRDLDGCSHLCHVEHGWVCTSTLAPPIPNPIIPSACMHTCGDGQLEPGVEGCDDGNLMDGDGCSHTCQVERGWRCSGEPSTCTTICGDGLIRGQEQCDDGNLTNGDGCNDMCMIERDWVCMGMPSVCMSLCGNGVLDPGEQCDDGNMHSGDGCSWPNCRVEIGWTCPTPGQSCVDASCGDGYVRGNEVCDEGPMPTGGCINCTSVRAGWTCPMTGGPCTTICGDGIVAGMEQCDDGNTRNGDGCSSTCTIEHGWYCSVAPMTMGPSTCHTTCGDGLIGAPVEQCDDHNTTNGDGCSSTCQIEPGWSCAGEPSSCQANCGDGIVNGNEQCDDGNQISGDGCSSSCQIEYGWYCMNMPMAASMCHTTCGDGLKANVEACDDGNIVNGDGCSSACMVELHWMCVMNMPMVHPDSLCDGICGDGFIRGTETCDDGNTTSADGCSSTCRVEPHWQCMGEPSHCNGICGDGFIRGTETCDDGNLVSGDGCSSTCMTEPHWMCMGEPSHCDGICGDGFIRGTETCDDGNAVSGDGCSAMCRIESGWSCTGEPSVCNSQCGDGVVNGPEQCDPPGAGCDSTCHVMAGWSCSGMPSYCQLLCGNCVIDPGETCDDCNNVSGDGCSNVCAIEAGYDCVRVPSWCAAISATAYVNGTAACPGAGTNASPYCTLASGVAAGRANVIVRNAAYGETIDLNGTNISLLCEQGVVINSNQTTSPALNIHGGAVVRIVGCQILGGSVRVNVDSSQGHFALDTIGPSALPQAAGIGMQMSGTASVTIDRSRVSFNNGGGISFLGSGQIVLTNDVINSNGSNGVSPMGGVRIGCPTGMTTCSVPVGSRFVNLTIAGNVGGTANPMSATGSGVRCDATGVTLQNTIVWANVLNGATASGTSMSCLATYSDINPSVSGMGNFNADPTYNAMTYDLMPGSPCIEAGDPAGILPAGPATPLDIHNNRRHPSPPNANRVDIGADEAG